MWVTLMGGIDVWLLWLHEDFGSVMTRIITLPYLVLVGARSWENRSENVNFCYLKGEKDVDKYPQRMHH